MRKISGKPLIIPVSNMSIGQHEKKLRMVDQLSMSILELKPGEKKSIEKISDRDRRES